MVAESYANSFRGSFSFLETIWIHTVNQLQHHSTKETVIIASHHIMTNPTTSVLGQTLFLVCLFFCILVLFFFAIHVICTRLPLQSALLDGAMTVLSLTVYTCIAAQLL